MSFNDCVEMCETMKEKNISLEKLKIVHSINNEKKKLKIKVPANSKNTQAGKIELLGFEREDGEDRAGFADGNSTYDSATITSHTYWKWKEEVYICKVECDYSYSCAGHSGGVEDYNLKDVRFKWKKFDDEIWKSVQDIHFGYENSKFLYSVKSRDSLTGNANVDTIIYFISEALARRDTLLEEEFPYLEGLEEEKQEEIYLKVSHYFTGRKDLEYLTSRS